jgi:SAM-dependent methyltransferase
VVAASHGGYSQCRICGSAAIIKRGDVEFYFGYSWPIYDCTKCGCRFTRHDASAYDLLYAESDSCYNRYIEQAESAKKLFDRGDLIGLKAELSKSAKYRFIIEQIDHEPGQARLLEIGCSRGHLTSYFLLKKCSVIGVDVSPTALGAATAAFGDHFMIAGDSRIERGAPYDLIYHVGTIGCVADPIGITRQLLGLLGSGGQLLFNAPNRDACSLQDQLWFDSAPPPDLVTMYRPGFWRTYFGQLAKVEESIEHESPIRNALIGLWTLAGRRWRRPLPIALKNSKELSSPAPIKTDRLWNNLERVVRRIGPSTGLLALAPVRPQEYGLFVKMRKR